MKKLFLFLMACCLSLTMSAKVAYLIPKASQVETEKVNDLPQEYCGSDEQSPERRAFNWFMNDYSGEKTVLYLNDLANIPADVNAIWIHVDRVNFNTAAFDAVFTSEVKENLKAFVNRGGNVFLAKQATRLEYDLVNAKHFSDDNRAELDYSDGGYVGAATWGARIQFYATNNEDDNNNHRVWGSYANHAMFKNAPHHSDSYLEYVWSDGKQITDHNSGFPIAQMDMRGGDWRLELWGFQQKNNCRVLGGWENSGDGNKGCIYGGIVEFYPTASRKGTVVMVGLAAYQWINNNAGNGFDNVKKSTEDLLKYLDNKPSRTDVHLDGDDIDFPTTGRDKYESSKFMALYKNVRGLDAKHEVTAGAENTEVITDGEVDRLVFKEDGDYTLKLTLTENREFQAWPKGAYEFTQNITFAFNKTKPDYAWPDALNANVNAGTEVELSDKADGFDVTYKFVPAENVDYNSQTVKFLKEGTVKIIAKVVVDKDVTTFPQSTYTDSTDVTVVPTLEWTIYPQSGFVGEEGKKAVATATGTTKKVVYSSSNSTAVAVDEDGNLTIHEAAGKVTITAAIEGTQFSISGEMEANAPVVEWVTAPEAEYFVSDQPEIKAQLKYWNDHELNYVCENCSVDNGKLIFTAADTAKVKAHVVLDGKDFYSEEKVIKANAVTFTWSQEPCHARVDETKSKPAAQATCNVPGAIVKYESSNATIAKIDETTGKITYLRAGKCNIYAYAEINGKKYKSDAFELNVLPSYYERTVNNTYTTICLPFEAEVIANVEKVFSLTGLIEDGSVITGIILDEVEGNLVAGTPYVIRTQGTPEVPIEITLNQIGEEVSEVVEANGLMGTFTAIEVTMATCPLPFYLSAADDMLHQIGAYATVRVGANKAYFDLSLTRSLHDGQAAPGRMIMGVQGRPVATDVENAIDATKAVKFIQNGKVYIRRANNVYDVLGK